MSSRGFGGSTTLIPTHFPAWVMIPDIHGCHEKQMLRHLHLYYSGVTLHQLLPHLPFSLEFSIFFLIREPSSSERFVWSFDCCLDHEPLCGDPGRCWAPCDMVNPHDGPIFVVYWCLDMCGGKHTSQMSVCCTHQNNVQSCVDKMTIQKFCSYSSCKESELGSISSLDWPYPSCCGWTMRPRHSCSHAAVSVCFSSAVVDWVQHESGQPLSIPTFQDASRIFSVSTTWVHLS